MSDSIEKLEGRIKALELWIKKTGKDIEAAEISEYIKRDGSRAFTGEQSMGSNKLTNVANPTSDQDAATKKWVTDNFQAK